MLGYRKNFQKQKWNIPGFKKFFQENYASEKLGRNFEKLNNGVVTNFNSSAELVIKIFDEELPNQADGCWR